MRHRLIGLIIIVFSIVLFWLWTSYGKDRLSQGYIPVLKEDIYSSDVLSEDIIEYKRIKIDENPIKKDEISKYMGWEAKHFVHKGAPLFSEYFLDRKLDPNIEKNKVVVSLSSHHIYNFVGNYKKGETVIFFSGKEIIIEAVVKSVEDDKKTIEFLTDKAGAARVSDVLSKGNKIVIARG